MNDTVSFMIETYRKIFTNKGIIFFKKLFKCLN